MKLGPQERVGSLKRYPTPRDGEPAASSFFADWATNPAIGIARAILHPQNSVKPHRSFRRPKGLNPPNHSVKPMEYLASLKSKH